LTHGVTIMSNNILGGGIRNFNLQRNQIRKSGKGGLNQSLIYTRPFPPDSRNFFICPFEISKKKKFLDRKISGGNMSPLATESCSFDHLKICQ